jgi:4-amino-4-deoxy-L-arabinose transferase-like glycosyltransferase
MIHATGALGLAAMIIAASLALMWAGSWPTWAGWLGVAVGILSLGSVVFFPQFLFLLWILIVSITLFLRSSRTPRTV